MERKCFWYAQARKQKQSLAKTVKHVTKSFFGSAVGSLMIDVAKYPSIQKRVFFGE
jgi:hypothetical protein